MPDRPPSPLPDPPREISMRERHIVFQRRALDFWLARGAVLTVVCLQLLVINQLSFGPRWLAPGVELTLLIPLSVATAWTQVGIRNAKADHHWQAVNRFRILIRRAALAMTA